MFSVRDGAALETDGPERERDQPKFPVQTQLSAPCQIEREVRTDKRTKETRGEEARRRNGGKKGETLKKDGNWEKGGSNGGRNKCKERCIKGGISEGKTGVNEGEKVGEKGEGVLSV